MRIESVELLRLQIPLVAPFRTSLGTEHHRDILLVHVVGDRRRGMGRVRGVRRARFTRPSTPTARAAVIRRFWSRAARAPETSAPSDVAAHPAAGPRPSDGEGRPGDGDARRRAAVARRRRSPSTSAPPGRASTAASRSGIHRRPSPSCSTRSSGYLDEGYRRIKLKIEPGIRHRAGRAPCASASATSPSRWTPTPPTRSTTPTGSPQLDAFDLLLIEQPLADEDLLGHAELAKAYRTPICLDESIPSAQGGRGRDRPRRVQHRQHQGRARRRLPRGAARPRRLPTRTAFRCGAAACSRPGSAGPRTSRSPRCPGFTLPGDTSASGRYYGSDITEPFVLERRAARRSDGPGPRRLAAPRAAGAFSSSERPTEDAASRHVSASAALSEFPDMPLSVRREQRSCSSRTRRSSGFARSSSNSSTRRRIR